MLPPKDISAPIFIRIKEKIKDDIMGDVYAENELIISTTQIAKLFSVNPATAVKSVSLLQDEGIVYKKRGIGMCVAEGAKEAIIAERTKQFYESSVSEIITEAKKLHIKKAELLKIISEVKDYD